jgi:hypothetical protein
MTGIWSDTTQCEKNIAGIGEISFCPKKEVNPGSGFRECAVDATISREGCTGYHRGCQTILQLLPALLPQTG